MITLPPRIGNRDAREEYRILDNQFVPAILSSEHGFKPALGEPACGAVDLLLLGSVMLTADALLWTLDRNLKALATRFEISFG